MAVVVDIITWESAEGRKEIVVPGSGGGGGGGVVGLLQGQAKWLVVGTF